MSKNNPRWKSTPPKPIPDFSDEHKRLFWEKVDKNGPNGCWVWMASKTTAGYGRYAIRVGGRTTGFLAHRIAYALTRGGAPSGFACHKCDNPICCNPEHIFFGDQSTNIRDAVAKGRHVANNRRFTAENVQEIRRLHESGLVGYKTIGRRFGVSGTAIRQITDRRVYRWVA